MLNTLGRNFGFEVDTDASNVLALPGVARVGDTLVQFQGAALTYSDMCVFDTNVDRYQNVLLYLYRGTDGGVDMTRAVSDVAGSQRALTLPNMIDSSGFPLGMFQFHKLDATTIGLKTYYII